MPFRIKDSDSTSDCTFVFKFWGLYRSPGWSTYQEVDLSKKCLIRSWGYPYERISKWIVQDTLFLNKIVLGARMASFRLKNWIPYQFYVCIQILRSRDTHNDPNIKKLIIQKWIYLAVHGIIWRALYVAINEQIACENDNHALTLHSKEQPDRNSWCAQISSQDYQ